MLREMAYRVDPVEYMDEPINVLLDQAISLGTPCMYFMGACRSRRGGRGGGYGRRL